MKQIACTVLLGAMIGLGAGCVEQPTEADPELELGLAADEPASMALEDAAAGSTSQLACQSKSLRVSVTGGTAYLYTNTCDSTRTAGVVNECSGSTVSWRVRSVATGSTIASGTKANCVGGGAGTFYQQIWLEVKNVYGYWEGFKSY